MSETWRNRKAHYENLLREPFNQRPTFFREVFVTGIGFSVLILALKIMEVFKA